MSGGILTAPFQIGKSCGTEYAAPRPMSEPVPQIHCEACGVTLPADTSRARYCLECDTLVCPACWKVGVGRCAACAASSSSTKSKRIGGSVSLRTARRADRRLREAAKLAPVVTGDASDAQDARVDLTYLTIKAAIAERVGGNALRKLTGPRAVRARPLSDRMRRHAVAAHAALRRADATLTGTDAATAPGTNAGAPGAPASTEEYRELHGARLHGFALLLTLGDRSAAARLAADALTAGASRSSEHEHPRQTAAWLRHTVLDAARGPRTDTDEDGATRRAALDGLGVDDTAFAALSALNVVERAAVVASNVELLEQRDVATILGLDEIRSQRIGRDALRRSMRTGIARRSEPEVDGPIVTRVREIAAQALG